MIPAVVDIKFTRGDTFEQFGRIRDQVWNPTTEEYEAGPYKDITGWTGLSQIRATADDPTVQAVISISIGNQVTAPGSFFMRMSPAVTAAVDPGDYVWDVQFTTPASDVYTYAGGKATCKVDVSKP